MPKHILLFALVIFFGCTKPFKAKESHVNLNIIETQTPQTQNVGEDIVSQVKCSAENLCYQFTNFQVDETSAREYEIHAIGTYPNHPTACMQAIYYKDTTVKINAAVKGQYLLHFLNNNVLFKTDTVEVN